MYSILNETSTSFLAEETYILGYEVKGDDTKDFTKVEHYEYKRNPDPLGMESGRHRRLILII